MPNKHHKLGGSTSARWLTCTASPNAIQQAKKQGLIPKEQQSSIYAEEGTAAHELLEKALRRKCDPEQFFMKKVNGFVVDEEMISAVDVHYQLVKEITDGFHSNFGLWLERRFNLSRYVGDDCGGSADITIYDPSTYRLYVQDYKHGKGEIVEAEGNTQTRLYGLGLLKELGKPVKDCELTIVQPRAAHIDGPIRTDKLSGRELQRWGRKTLKPAVAEINSDNAKFVASEKACKWCPLNGICEASKNQALEVLKTEFVDDELPAVNQLTFEEAELIVQNEKRIIEWLKAVRLQFHKALESGSKSDNFKLIQGVGNRAYEKESAIIRKLKKQKIPEKVYLTEPTLRSPAQLEKSLAEYHVMSMKEAKEFVNGITVRPETGYRVAPANSGLTEIPSTAQADFEEVAIQEAKKPRRKRKS